MRKTTFILIVICVITGFFAVIEYYAYKHYIDKYVHVEVANCSNAKPITDDKTSLRKPCFSKRG